MSKSTFFKKIFSGYLIVIILSILIITFLSFNIIKSHYIETLSNNLQNISTALKPEIQQLIFKENYNDIELKVEKVAKEMNRNRKLRVRITVIGEEGIVYGDSEAEPMKMDNHRSREEIAEALDGELGQTIRFSRTMDQEMLYVAVPISINGKVNSVLRSSLYMEDVNGYLGGLKLKLVYLFLGVTILSILIALVISKGSYAPLKKLNKAAKNISQGDFSSRVYIDTEGEIKKLGDTFNNMAERINELFQDIKKEKESLDCIFSSVFAGIVVLDPQGKIKTANEKFKEYFGDKYQDKYIWEILQKRKIADFFERLKKNKKNFSKQISWQNKVYLCSFSYAKTKNEYIIIFNDITEIKEVERVKKDFVSNVSHELRTPLTTIKGFIETMKMEEVDEERKRYLDIMHRHTDRLINIVKDLLTLSKLEKKGETIEKEQINFQEMIENLSKIYKPKAREKGLDYNVDVEEDIDYIGDEFKISQIISNLVDNGIKYTDQGEINISISKNNHNLRIVVEDTGIGIPEEERKRIFERFYVVDKSRSRSSGGTGLGLSIIKHIIQLYSGTINVKSTIGEGTKFIIELPDQRE